MATYESKDILGILPHRHPFILVDRIIEGNDTDWIVGIMNVTASEPWVEGHFPGQPAVLTLLAQLLPVPAGKQMQAVEARIVAQQFAMRLLRQPGEVGFRPQASQGRDDARGHDDVADGAQANDEDAPG